MEFEMIKRETLKPSSPTPQYLRNFKLSLLNQLSPAAYESLVLFYPRNDSTTPQSSLRILKKSLSETLVRFYPLAGRMKDNISVDCNDYGVDYVEAKVNGLLSTFLSQPDAGTLRQLLPVATESPEASKGALLLVQANVFGCGGLAIGMRMSHKLADAASLSTFIMSWSATALGFSQALLPDFTASFRFPPIDYSSSFHQSSPVDAKRENCVAKRFVFNASKISALRTKAASTIVDQPTQAEAVTALIWRCAVAASRSSNSLQPPPKLSVLSQSVDIRKSVVPPLSDDSIGNLMGYYAAQTDENELELQGLVAQLRRGIEELSNNYAKGPGKDQAIRESVTEVHNNFVKRDDTINFYVGTDLGNYKLLYEVNFGWGKPIWLSNVPAASSNNVAYLVSTRKDDGIEAWVTLSEEDMAAFERNQELLAFALMNPSVLLQHDNLALKSAL